MSSNIPTIIEFWAKSKPFQSVITHGMVSGKVAQHLYDSYLSEGIRSLVQSRLSLSENETRDFVGYLSSLHDIGKVELEFQRKDDAMLKKLLDSDWKDYLIGAPKHGIRHEKTGKDIAKAIWKARKEPRNARDFCSKIIGAHHQGKGGMGNFSKMKDLFDLQKAFEEQMSKTFLAGREPSLPEIDDSDEGILGAVFLGIVILADWISSGPVFADAEAWIYTDDANNIIDIRTRDFLETDAMKSVKGGSYAIGSPENGFWALEDDMAYNDSEDSPLVIQTRMSMPSVKIVLLDQEDFDSLGIQIEETPEGKVATVLSKKTAEAIMRKSVSVQTKKLGSENDDKDYIQGDGLIQNVRLYITQDQICHLNNGKSMWIDHDLGLMIGD